jgi:hypothetical protein
MKTLIVSMFILGICLPAESGGQNVEIEGVDRYRVWGPLFEGVRVIMTARGEDYSAAYIQGISGEAFRVAGICPCAPTCSHAMETQHLLELLGYDYSWLHFYQQGEHPVTGLDEAVDLIRSELEEGRPVLAWNAFTLAEWDVIAGYYGEKGVFTGRGSYAGAEEYAEASVERIAEEEVCPPVGVILVGEKTGEFDARAAELEAVREAVRHGRTAEPEGNLFSTDEWRMLEGLACYDRWVRETTESPESIPELGNRYCLAVYASTHGMAAEFLREIAGSWPEASDDLLAAAELFEEESGRLRECMNYLYPEWNHEPDWEDREVRTGATEILSAARDAYSGALERLEAALLLMEEANAGE